MTKNHDETMHTGGSLVGGGLSGRGLVSGNFKSGGLTGKSVWSRGLAEGVHNLATGDSDRALSQVQFPIDRLGKADPKDVQGVAASQLQITVACHKLVLAQAHRCFLLALVGAGLGIVFFLLAAATSIVMGNAIASTVLIVSGLMLEAVAGLLFYLYGRAAAQSHEFHVRLDAIQRHILANSICEGLSGDRKEQTRAELARKVANIQNVFALTTPPQQPFTGGQTPPHPSTDAGRVAE